jgi:hypothetical protein
MSTSTFNGHEIRPRKKRYGMQQIKKRAAKAVDRSTFRERVVKSFEVMGNGMQIFDAAIATTYTRGKRAGLVLLVWLVVLTAYVVWMAHR